MSSVIESAVVFECEGDRLVGILHAPLELAKRIGIVIVVGGPQYRVGSHRQFTIMARAFAQSGYPVLRFDYRGMGDSDGNFKGFEQVDSDIRSAIDALCNAAPGLDGVVLWGLCDAASACMIYGNQKDVRVKGLALANPWVRTGAGEASAYLKHYYLRRLLQRSFWIKVFSGTFNVRRSLGQLLGMVKQAQSLQEFNTVNKTPKYIDIMLRGIRQIQGPVLLIVSGCDLTAKEFENLCARDSAWRTQMRVGGNTRLFCPRADHTFSSHDELFFAAAECNVWLEKLTARKM